MVKCLEYLLSKTLLINDKRLLKKKLAATYFVCCFYLYLYYLFYESFQTQKLFRKFMQVL